MVYRLHRVAAMRYALLLPALALLAVAPAAAQTPADPCAPVEALLDAGHVSARLANDGSLFRMEGYEAPKGSGLSPTFAAGFWIGGRADEALRVTVGDYTYLFRGGQLDDAGQPPADCAAANRIFELRRDDLEALAGGTVTANVRDWPALLGAPVVDGDGVPDNYDPAAGDRPALLGDQMRWWVMNDLAATRPDHLEAPPVGVDVRVTAFAFDTPGAVGHTTFYRFAVTYHGAAPLADAYLGFYADDDLGNPFDDHVGADTTLDLAYTYNGDDDDDASYGAAPPAFGYALLRGPEGDDGGALGLETFVNVQKGANQDYGEPVRGTEYYNILQGYWTGGDPIYVGGDGTPDDERADLTAPTRIHFPGDPTDASFWSMTNVDGNGTPLGLWDKRFAFSSGPFTFEPGSTEELWLAVVFSRGTDYLDSVSELKADVAYLRGVADGLFAPRGVTTSYVPPRPAPPLDFAPPFPNPATERALVRYSVPRAMPARLSLYDALGREVVVLADGTHAPGAHAAEVDVRGLAPGTYFVRLALHGTAFTRALVVVR